MNSFTPNYNLDLYDVDDKPNLNDQYNAAITKVDTELSKQSGDIVTAETAVANLTTTVQGYAESIQTNTADIAKLKTDVAKAQTTAENGVSLAHDANDLAMQASSAAQTAQTDATNALNQISALKTANKMVVIGDSWSSTPNSHANELWWQKYAQAKSLIASNFSVSGAGYNPNTESGSTFYSQLVNANSTMNAADKQKVKEIWIMGGLNDALRNTPVSESTITEALIYAHSNFPNATIHGCFNGTASLNTTQTNLSQDGPFFKAFSSKSYAVWHSIYRFMFASSNLFDDSLHPNTVGQNAVADFLLSNGYTGGHSGYIGNASITKGTTMTAGSVAATAFDNVVKFQLSGIAATFTNGIAEGVFTLPNGLSNGTFYAQPLFNPTGFVGYTRVTNGKVDIVAFDTSKTTINSMYGTFEIFI